MSFSPPLPSIILPLAPLLPSRLLVVLSVVVIVALAFFAAEITSARAPYFLLEASKEPPQLELAEGKQWHLFLSHNWDNQDAVAIIKRQLQLLLPGVRVFVSVGWA